MMDRWPKILAVCTLALIASVFPARADAIDGQWCLGSSHFEINGQNIRTPGGNTITGNYDRHGNRRDRQGQRVRSDRDGLARAPWPSEGTAWQPGE
jgi:hypothetical protein